MKSFRFILPAILGVATLVILFFGSSLFRGLSAPAPSSASTAQMATSSAAAASSAKVRTSLARVRLATSTLDNRIRSIPPTPLISGHAGPISTNDTREIKDALTSLEKEQQDYEKQVNALVASSGSNGGDKSPVQLAVTAAGFLSTVLSMWFSWQADRRDKRRLENEILEMKSKLNAQA